MFMIDEMIFRIDEPSMKEDLELERDLVDLLQTES